MENITEPLPEEFALRVNVNGTDCATLICTNEALEELVCGYLYNEGILSSYAEITKLQIEGHRASVTLKKEEKPPVQYIRTTGFGGVQISEKVRLEPREIQRIYSLDMIRGLAKQTETQAERYFRTGGMHSAAMYDGYQRVAMFEDIGRHNTLDKIAGLCLIQDTVRTDCLLITSGRVSSDMVRKAGRMGVSVIASYTTPTKEAVQMASEANITVIGYLNKEKVVAHCGSRRII